MKSTWVFALVTVVLTSGFGFAKVTNTKLKKKTKEVLGECQLEDLNRSGIGDVKYSLLGETAFQQVNGNGWVLLKKQNLGELSIPAGVASVFDYVNSTDNFSTTNLPDARGMYLRGKSFDRNDGMENPDGDLLIGQEQADEIKSHSHGLVLKRGAEPLSGGAQGELPAGNHGSSSVSWSSSQAVSSFGGLETRPKSVTVNIFVKAKQNCLDQVATDYRYESRNRVVALENFIASNSCDSCLILPESNLTELRAKHVCHKSEVDAFEADQRAWNVSCQARTIGHAKRILMTIGASDRTTEETDFLNHIDNQYPFYNVIETNISL